MGEGAVTRAPAVIASVGLGSCVVLMLYDPGPRIGGLAHILLPRAPVKSVGATGPGQIPMSPQAPAYLYADTALTALVTAMRGLGATVANMYAMIAGGARMFSDNEPTASGMGPRNIMSVKEHLKRAKICLIGEDTGGSHGRSVVFHLGSGRAVVWTIGGSTKEIVNSEQ